MKIKYVTTLMVMTLAGCGDYESVSIPSLDLSEDQVQDLINIQVANLSCAAISRYSNDIGSPLEDQSYLSNAETAFEIMKSSNRFKGKNGVDEFYQDMKVKIYGAVAQDLNNSNSLMEFYNDVFPLYGEKLGVKQINDCADVSAVTRRVLDPLLIL
ncbi:hypothetical protein HKA89_05385 [Vibrio parahaemolyticus]|uniref:hypothetical protein n=1 Tax=Vibrio parahaemolyticus TaxID=670 RepID=UPI00146F36E9|nr:hypothetical protein [Vibrio parahaemolyticus]MDF5276959.1 hypothetical protein [Vibrio parahaemolyticus]NMU68201.1 hypothetical protein [Vibrio parahaemolyticus]